MQHELLIRLKACAEAQQYAREYTTLQEAWDNCTRVDWLFWLAARTNQHTGVVAAAKEIVKSVQHSKRDDAAYADAMVAAVDAVDAAYAVDAAVATAMAADAAVATAYRQRAKNVKIAKKHLHCPV